MARPGFDPSLGPISRTESDYYDAMDRHISPRTEAGAFRQRRNPDIALRWYGEGVHARVAAVAMAAVKEIAERAAEFARDHHPWRNQSYDTEGSIWVGDPYITSADVVRCAWGAGGAAIFLEFGTVKMPAYPFLRPAQDASYPHLIAAMRV